MKSIIINEFERASDMERNLKPKQVPFQIGLPNNEQTTDYMNACLVSLCSSKKFVSLFGSKEMKNMVSDKNILLFYTSKLVTLLYCNNQESVHILKKKFEDSFFQYSRELNGLFKREFTYDPHFFLVTLLQWLKDLLDKTRETAEDHVQCINDAVNCLNNFYVNMKRKIRCSNGHVTIKNSLRTIIELELDGNTSPVLTELIANYFHEEKSTNHSNINRECNECLKYGYPGSNFISDSLTFLPETIVFYVNIFELDSGNVSKTL